MECVCGICLHWDSDQCNECECCKQMHDTFASDKHKI